jgi:hypothetical protein
MDPATPALASIGIDIGKDAFHLVGFDTNGKIAFRRKIKRLALAEAFKTLPPPHRGHGGLPQLSFCQSRSSPARP